MAPSANVLEAIGILRGGAKLLADAERMGYRSYVLVPGDVAVPEEGMVIAQRDPTEPKVLDALEAVVWPRAQYQAWQAAWEIAVAYAGWWGKRARWPLGDGERARTDRIAASKLVPIGVGRESMTLALDEITSTRPPVAITAVLAPLVFLAGTTAAGWSAYRRIRMLR